jgi:hypothetical protein
MYLPADRSGDPSGMPAGLGRVDRGNHWHVIAFSKCDSGMSHQPVMGVHDVRPPRPTAATVLETHSGAHHRVAHCQCPGHHVGAEAEFVRVLRGGDDSHTLVDFVRRRMRAGIGAGRAPGQHHDVVAGRGQRRGQVMHVPTEPTDHHRRVFPRHHQDSHRGSLRASSAPNSPSARFQPSASRWAASRRPEANVPAISRVAWACRCAR